MVFLFMLNPEAKYYTLLRRPSILMQLYGDVSCLRVHRRLRPGVSEG
jgi:hypothetical protein